MVKALTLNILCGLILFAGACAPEKAVRKSPELPVSSTTEIQNWQDGFPKQWWAEVPRKDAKSWETLPQDANKNEVILSKRTELGIFSNFAEAPFVYRGVCYPTIEGFWQMMKFPEDSQDPRFHWVSQWKYSREQVSQMDGYKAKSAGSYANKLMEKYDINWVTFENKKIRFYSKSPGEHYQLIYEALVEKLRQNPEVAELLLKTKDLILRPDHNISANSPAEWHYYKLWMEIRSDLQQGRLSLTTQEDLSLRTCRAL